MKAIANKTITKEEYDDLVPEWVKFYSKQELLDIVEEFKDLEN